MFGFRCFGQPGVTEDDRVYDCFLTVVFFRGLSSRHLLAVSVHAQSFIVTIHVRFSCVCVCSQVGLEFIPCI